MDKASGSQWRLIWLDDSFLMMLMLWREEYFKDLSGIATTPDYVSVNKISQASFVILIRQNVCQAGKTLNKMNRTKPWNTHNAQWSKLMFLFHCISLLAEQTLLKKSYVPKAFRRKTTFVNSLAIVDHRWRQLWGPGNWNMWLVL